VEITFFKDVLLPLVMSCNTVLYEKFVT